jgi:hypothetical protein
MSGIMYAMIPKSWKKHEGGYAAKILKKRKNTPAHPYLDDTPYFITAIIYQSRKLMADPPLKMALLELIQTYFVKFNWTFIIGLC